MSDYPEHVKLENLDGHNQTAGEFLDWLVNDKGFSLCKWQEREETEDYSEPSGYSPTHVSINTLLNEFFDLDPDKLEAEKREILEGCRKSYE
jgi:hypothetical protein